MTVAFELTWVPEERDWVDAFLTVGRAQRRRLLAIAVTWSAVVAVIGFTMRDLTLLTIGVTLSCYFLYAMGPGRTRAPRSIWRRSPALQRRRKVRVSPELGVITLFAGSATVDAWSRYASVIETERMFVLVVGDILYNPIQVIAKRGLSPGVDPALLGDYLRAHIGRPTVEQPTAGTAGPTGVSPPETGSSADAGHH